jgi:4-amino-4-deoxy-L-arabinose transferase-like glycosyltransferase
LSYRGKLLLSVFAVALALRVAMLVHLLPQLRPDVDRDWYRALARSLAAGQGYVAPDEKGHELPHVWLPPVYPLLLAGLMKIGGDRLVLFLAVQCLLGSVACALTSVLAARWLSWNAAALAGLLVAIDPNSVLRCSDLSTEMVFTPLLVGGACLLAWRRERASAWFWCGLLWSVGALCRPIALWLWVVALIVVLTWRLRLRVFAMFLAGFVPLLGVWAARNASLTGHWFVSTVATSNLFFYRAAGVEGEKQGVDIDEMIKRLRAEYADVQFFSSREQFDHDLDRLRQKSEEILLSAPLIAFEQNAAGWGRVLFGPGLRGMHNALREPQRPSPWWPIYCGALAVAVGLCVLGAIHLGREGVLIGVLTIYFVGLAGGPSGSSRFRVPITPMLATLAVAGAQCLKKKV